MFGYCHGKEVFTNVQSEFPLVQILTIPTTYRWISGRGAQHLLVQVLPLGSCRETWGSSSASFLPNKTKSNILSCSSQNMPWCGQKAQTKTLLEGELNTVEKEAGLIHSSDLGINWTEKANTWGKSSTLKGDPSCRFHSLFRKEGWSSLCTDKYDQLCLVETCRHIILPIKAAEPGLKATWKQKNRLNY